MRARNLKPGFFKNDLLAECDPLARLLFQGLWCMADREGRMELRPKRIKAEILPYDNADIFKLLNQLVHKGFIVAYRYDNEFFLSIPTFTQHQNPHIKEAESTIQAPCESDACTILARLNPESLLLNPESPSPSPVHGEHKTKKFNQEEFDQFWQSYPKKKNKGVAEKAWKNIEFNNGLFKQIIDKLEILKGSFDWLKENGRFIPHPATWLNRKGWEDEPSERFNPVVSDSTLGMMDWARRKEMEAEDDQA